MNALFQKLKKLTRFYKKRGLHFHMNPYRDWLLLLIFFVIFSSAAFLYTGFVFLTSYEGAVYSEFEDDGIQEIINIERLQEITALYDQRVFDFEELKLQPPTIVDPSQ